MSIAITQKITGYAVQKPGESNANDGFIKDDERRLVLPEQTQPLEMRWVKRPTSHEGNDAKTYMIESPTHRFGVVVGHVPNGSPATGYPFECWVLGEAPRGLSAVCKSLSMDMRTNDRAWLQRKLQALFNDEGVPFDFTMPDARVIRVESEVAAFAHLVHYRCTELGAFDDEKLTSTPYMDARICKKEPKAGPEGTMALNVSVKNVSTGDDFEMFVKQGRLPNGQIRPVSVWFSGGYAKALDALAKSLSLDFQIADVRHAYRKLHQLLDVDEPRGDFLAQVPGSEKQRSYPSTVAYIADILLHHFRVLGLFDGIEFDDKVVTLVPVKQSTAGEPKGLLCEGCQTYSARLEAGCLVCHECGFSRCS